MDSEGTNAARWIPEVGVQRSNKATIGGLKIEQGVFISEPKEMYGAFQKYLAQLFGGSRWSKNRGYLTHLFTDLSFRSCCRDL